MPKGHGGPFPPRCIYNLTAQKHVSPCTDGVWLARDPSNSIQVATGAL